MIKGIVFDLDGTLYFGEKVAEGAVDVVNTLVRRDYKVFYLTNNSGKTHRQIIEKLNRLGFLNAYVGNTYCGSYAIASYLVANDITSVYVIGTEGLVNDLVSSGIWVDNSFRVSAVVVGLDPFFSYEKIVMALKAIDNGAKLIVANTDSSYPVGNGFRLPGCGAMVAAIVAVTGRAPDFHVGKPNAFMLDLICRDHGLSAGDICMIGDMPESDIAAADVFGCQSILFDLKNEFSKYSGNRVRKLCEIIPFLNGK